jgi:hypothetical protein
MHTSTEREGGREGEGEGERERERERESFVHTCIKMQRERDRDREHGRGGNGPYLKIPLFSPVSLPGEARGFCCTALWHRRQRAPVCPLPFPNARPGRGGRIRHAGIDLPASVFRFLSSPRHCENPRTHARTHELTHNSATHHACERRWWKPMAGRTPPPFEKSCLKASTNQPPEKESSLVPDCKGQPGA